MGDGDKTMVRPLNQVVEATELPNDLYVSIEVIEGPDKGMKANITHTRTMMGRGPVDIQFLDQTVSSKHAILEYSNYELILTDQGSSNGTFVNGEQVESAVVNNMDEIKLAGTKMLLSVVNDVYGTYGEEQAPAADEQDFNAITQPRRQIPNPPLPGNIKAMIQITDGPDKGKKYMIDNQSTLVGRRDGTDIRVNDESVSRVHCQIFIRDPNTMGIKDLVSTNGTFLNGKIISSFKVKHGDEIQIGDTKFKLMIAVKQGG